MSSRKVTTQAELDRALADRVDYIDIYSPAGVWLELRATGSSSVTATGSSSVTAYDSSSVRAYDSSSVRAYDSSSVTAYGSSSVTATGSSSVRAYDSSSVTATGSSSVTATGSSSVTATPYVAVHLHSQRVTLSGGVVIDVTTLDQTDVQTWCDYTGVETTSKSVIVYKAVDAGLKSERGFHYPLGKSVTVEDWTETNGCGGGLHFSPSPAQALAYFPTATRFLACRVKVADLRSIPGGTAKCKARKAKVLYEVDVQGRMIEVSA